jgi:hypothetical protein
MLLRTGMGFKDTEKEAVDQRQKGSFEGTSSKNHRQINK